MPRIDTGGRARHDGPAAAPSPPSPLLPTVIAALARRPRSTPPSACYAVATLFFRDPDRTPDHAAVPTSTTCSSPADGMVMHAGAAAGGRRPDGEWQQVSIFLSAVRRAHQPLALRRPGRRGRPHARAVPRRLPHESAHRERAQRDHRRAAGRRRAAPGASSARSSACWPAASSPAIEPGDELATGERMGLMKFGSRMDVFVPPECDCSRSSKGDRVVAGETVIARWARPAAGDAA